MLCDMCHKNEAIIYVEQTNRLGTKKVNLCRDCAVSCGISPESQEIDRQIGSLFQQILRDRREKLLKDDRACPVCGRLRSEIVLTGRLGCPECYAIFKSEALEYLKSKKVQGPYTGTMPKRLANFRSALTDRVIVREKLEDAVRREDYEKAAFYRDYLKAIEKKSVAAPSDAAPNDGDL